MQRSRVTNLFIALFHYPVYNKNYKETASAITTLDIHDIARVARTYGVRGYFIVTPLRDQRELAYKVIKHWTDGYGSVYNPLRREALRLVSIRSSLDEVIEDIERVEGKRPILIATDARRYNDKEMISYQELRKLIMQERLILILFGTAWGLTEEFLNKMDMLLEPIEGYTDYNHLSVRSAAAIILDRLLGKN
ncbi:MAG TPA: RNA methyltransferase [Desulfobacteraceae bacterium]|nr:RNA methyltransferase [Desulfobacteraceae bacterium]